MVDGTPSIERRWINGAALLLRNLIGFSIYCNMMMIIIIVLFSYFRTRIIEKYIRYIAIRQVSITRSMFWEMWTHRLSVSGLLLWCQAELVAGYSISHVNNSMAINTAQKCGKLKMNEWEFVIHFVCFSIGEHGFSREFHSLGIFLGGGAAWCINTA